MRHEARILSVLVVLALVAFEARSALWAQTRASTEAPDRQAQVQGTVQGTVQVRGGRADNIVVLLTPLTSAGVPAVPPPGPLIALIDQRGLQFLPQTIAVWSGTVVSFPNSDPVLHNIFIVDEARTRVDLGTYPSGEFREITLSAPGAYLVLCHLHPEMVANILVTDAPYRAVTDSVGRFSLDEVPPGAYHMRTWHRRLAPSDTTITTTAGEATSVRLLLDGSTRRPSRRRPRGPITGQSVTLPRGVP